MFDIYHRMFDWPQIMVPVVLLPGAPSDIHQYPIPDMHPAPATSTSPASTTRKCQTWWTLPDNFLLPHGVILHKYVSKFLNMGELFLVLDNVSMVRLSWSLCGSFSVYFHKHSYHGAHHHLTDSGHHSSLTFKNVWCQHRTAPSPLSYHYIPLPPLPPPMPYYNTPSYLIIQTSYVEIGRGLCE